MISRFCEADSRGQGVKESWCVWLKGLLALAFHSLDEVRSHELVKPLIEKPAGASEILQLVAF